MNEYLLECGLLRADLLLHHYELSLMLLLQFCHFLLHFLRLTLQHLDLLPLYLLFVALIHRATEPIQLNLSNQLLGFRVMLILFQSLPHIW